MQRALRQLLYRSAHADFFLRPAGNVRGREVSLFMWPTVSWRRYPDQAVSVQPMHHARPALPKRSSPMIGSGRLLRKSSVDAKVIGWLLAAIWTMPVWAAEQPLLRRYEVVGDAIPDSLTGSKGDPTVGRTIVLSRQSTCLLCHSGPFPEERFQGNVGPDLSGAGSRWSEGQLRLRIVDAARLNPATIMLEITVTGSLNAKSAMRSIWPLGSTRSMISSTIC